MIKSAIIYLFSGTGNTRKVVKQFATLLGEKGVKCSVREMEWEFVPPTGFDAVGIAYPVHAFNAPENVLALAKKLPDGEGKQVFFIKTGGEPLSINNASSAKLASIMKKKGYEIFSEYHYVMPYNMLYRHTESMATKMWFTAKRMIERDVADFASDKGKSIGKGTPISFIFRNVEQPFMRFNGKHFTVADDSCIECGKCIKNCPQKNINIVDGQFQFGKNCIGCVRCSFNCPTNAIDIGIINMWKVNGGYTYGDTEPEEAECKYLKKAYKKYFEKNK